METKAIYILIPIIILLGIFLAYQYIFSIYEVVFTADKYTLHADNSSSVIIQAVPINGLGWQAPFRSAPAKFEIKEGADLIEVLKNDTENGTLILKSKYTAGKVIITMKSIYSLMPSEIEIIILPNLT